MTRCQHRHATRLHDAKGQKRYECNDCRCVFVVVVEPRVAKQRAA